MALSKKHYKAIIDIVKGQKYMFGEYQISLLQAFADYFAQDNAEFDRSKFWEYYRKEKNNGSI